MKLLLFSDNHRDRASLESMIEQNPNIETIISLGDSEMREHELTNLNVFGVRGNYPTDPKFPKELTLEFENHRFFFTHGHHFSVKLGLRRLLNHALYNKIEVACFGHTHKAYVNEVEGVILLNPGSLSKYKLGTMNSYAILDIEPNRIKIEIKTLNGEILYEHIKQR